MTIDHDARRREIARLTIEIVAEEGLQAASIRRIAAAGDWSTAAITNYFIDKQELLTWTFQLLAERGELAFETALGESDGDPVPALMTMVPWCPDNVRRWKAFLAFWDGAARDPEIAELLAQSTRTGTDLLEQLVTCLMPGQPDVREEAELLSAAIQGLALQIVVDGADWDEAKIRRMLDRSLNGIIGTARTPADPATA